MNLSMIAHDDDVNMTGISSSIYIKKKKTTRKKDAYVKVLQTWIFRLIG